MLFPFLNRLRRGLNPVLTALVLGAPATVPLLDRGATFAPLLQGTDHASIAGPDHDYGSAASPDHDHTPASGSGHDHTLCIQIQANAPVTSVWSDPVFADRTVEVHASCPGRVSSQLHASLPYRSRAPPLA